jgi:hypothetical protein
MPAGPKFSTRIAPPSFMVCMVVLMLVMVLGGAGGIAALDDVDYGEAVFLQVSAMTTLGIRVESSRPAAPSAPGSLAIVALTSLIGMPVFLFVTLEALWWMSTHLNR